MCLIDRYDLDQERLMGIRGNAAKETAGGTEAAKILMRVLFPRSALPAGRVDVKIFQQSQFL